MLFSQIPTKFPIPFANNAGAGFTNPIPQNSQIGITGGAASLFDGFPPLTFVPVGAGGIPPWGRDFNGLLNQMSAWNRWQAAGGPVKFDAAFSTAVGGYPQGAVLESTTAGNMWVSLVDNNTQDPDATPGASQWAGVAFITPVQNNTYISADDTGVTDAYVIAPLPAPAAYVKYQRFQGLIAHANVSTTPTLNVTGVGGALGARVIVRPNGQPLASGDMSVGQVAVWIYDGANMQLQNPAASAGASGGFGFNVQTFLAPGTYTWIVPAGKTFAYVRGWGGGGGIGGSIGSMSGAGGGWFEGPVTVSPGQRITVIVGDGGTFDPFVPDGIHFALGGSTSFGNFATATGGGGNQGAAPGTAAVTGQIFGGIGNYQQGNQIFNLDGSIFPILSGPGWQPFGMGRVGPQGVGPPNDSGKGSPGAVVIWY